MPGEEDDDPEQYVDFPCPSCCEARVDYLDWEDDETVKCRTCGRTYRP